MRIEIVNGHIIDPKNKLDQQGSLYIADGKIVGIMQAPDGFSADTSLNAQGHIVCPGFVDLSARLREPGQSHKATMKSETKAAASAGFTSLCIPPDTNPAMDSPAIVELIEDKAEKCGYPHIYPIAALTQKLAGTELSAMHALKKAGCIAVSNVHHALQNLLVLRRAMEYAATYDLLLIYCPQEASLSNNGCAHEGAMASRYGLPGIPVAAETIALMQCIELIEQTGCRVHFRGLSCARSVDLIAKAKTTGLPVTADVAMHQLHLTDADMRPYDSHYHVIPPLRNIHDRDALLAGIKNGTIDSICSDHQPHDVDAKLGAFPETEPGISTLETVLPLMLRLVAQKTLTLTQGIAKLSSEPARILGMNTGHLALNNVADMCIFNTSEHWQINAETWQSRGQNTPFWQETMQGKVVHTIQAGKIIYSAKN
ncbi:MAG: dihydroorotase [Methylococcaceae bacterium]|nr:dihydroorotase [Methylococcaceae bacterium]